MNANNPKPLTQKEKAVLEMIEHQISEGGVSPSYQEIKDHFGFASFNSVQNYLKQLVNKGYLLIANNQKRSIQVLHSSKTVQHSVQQMVQTIKKPTKIGSPRESLLLTPSGREEILDIPLLGKVAAGIPLESLDYDEFIQVPRSMIRNPEKSYALKVKGASMIEDGILDGDIILVQKQQSATNGETIVARIENEATVKKFFLRARHESPLSQTLGEDLSLRVVELKPANSTMSSLWYESDQVEIQGVVVGLIRKF